MAEKSDKSKKSQSSGSDRSDKPKVFDVSKPGQTAANPTSRPIIVGHNRAIVQDPMVTPEPDTKPEEPESQLEPKHEAKLTVPSEEPEPEEEKTPEPPQGTEAPKAGEENQPQDGDIADALNLDGASAQREQERLLEAELAKTAEIEKLIASKKYFVKIRIPKGKRHGLWLLFFLVLAGAAVGWYLMLGPGKDMWATKTANDSAQDMPLPQTPQPKAPVAADKTVASIFTDPKLGIEFTYPKDWKVESTKDTVQKDVDVITISAPSQKIESAFKGVQNATSETFLRTKIYVENTVNTKQYPNRMSALTQCSSETIVVNNANFSLLFVGTGVDAPNIAAAFLSQDSCKSTTEKVSANDKIQFSKKKNTYVIKSEYVYTEAHLKSIGTNTKESITLGQAVGIVVTKDNFKNTDAFKSLTELLKSVKEL